MIKYEEEIGKIAKNIKSIRKAKGLTEQELAYRCEMERSNLSRLEAGKTNMTIKTLCIICNALNVKLSEII